MQHQLGKLSTTRNEYYSASLDVKIASICPPYQGRSSDEKHRLWRDSYGSAHQRLLQLYLLHTRAKAMISLEYEQ